MKLKRTMCAACAAVLSLGCATSAFASGMGMKAVAQTQTSPQGYYGVYQQNGQQGNGQNGQQGYQNTRQFGGQGDSEGGSNRFSVSQDTYIIQDGADLWLIMGNMKAKLSVLIYADEYQTRQMESSGQDALVIPFLNTER